MSKDIIDRAQELVNRPPTMENARHIGRLISQANGEEKDFIYDLIESFLMQVEEPSLRESLLEEIG